MEHLGIVEAEKFERDEPYSGDAVRLWCLLPGYEKVAAEIKGKVKLWESMKRFLEAQNLGTVLKNL